jgi:hypothetical protein
MATPMGLLRIRVQRGINLAVRDTVSSDPYVAVSMGLLHVIITSCLLGAIQGNREPLLAWIVAYKFLII